MASLRYPGIQTLWENSTAVRLISHASLTVINGGKDMSLSIYNMQTAMHCWALFICWQLASRLHTDSYANGRDIKHSALPPYTLPSKNTLCSRAVWWKSVLILARKVKCNFGKNLCEHTVHYVLAFYHICNFIPLLRVVWNYIKVRVSLIQVIAVWL